ncbi:unnamed protein product [Arabidopsis thaliana]|uniref:(thale cress) hypothetical protein n=1 Tax=Arabidopsis thaliana TaxID=3702 RepID=A0A7G2EBJ7_ARATH|nr:unnamed protein product [Arabidopsis thaliana]
MDAFHFKVLSQPYIQWHYPQTSFSCTLPLECWPHQPKLQLLPFFALCLEAQNLTTSYPKSLRLACREGRAEEGLALLLIIPSSLPHATFATSLLELCLGKYDEAMHTSVIVTTVFHQIIQIDAQSMPRLFALLVLYDVSCPMCLAAENNTTKYLEGCALVRNLALQFSHSTCSEKLRCIAYMLGFLILEKQLLSQNRYAHISELWEHWVNMLTATTRA